VKEALTEASASLAAQNWEEARQLFDKLEDKMLASLVCKLGLAAAELGLDNPAQALRNTLAVRCFFALPQVVKRSRSTPFASCVCLPSGLVLWFPLLKSSFTGVSPGSVAVRRERQGSHHRSFTTHRWCVVK